MREDNLQQLALDGRSPPKRPGPAPVPWGVLPASRRNGRLRLSARISGSRVDQRKTGVGGGNPLKFEAYESVYAPALPIITWSPTPRAAGSGVAKAGDALVAAAIGLGGEVDTYA